MTRLSTTVPVERVCHMAERDRIQLGHLWRRLVLRRNRNVVVDQLAAAAREDRRPVVKHARYYLAVWQRAI